MLRIQAILAGRIKKRERAQCPVTKPGGLARFVGLPARVLAPTG
jgi:hypothetical protein